MSRINKIFRLTVHELFTSWRVSSVLGLLCMLVFQLYFLLSSDLSNITLISFISGVLSSICIFEIIEKKISNYVWGILQAFVYCLLTIHYHLYGIVLVCIITLVIQVFGIRVWISRVSLSEKVNTTNDASQKLSVKYWLLILSINVVLIVMVTLVMRYFHAQYPLLNGAIIILTLTAQALMAKFYSAQWLFWILIDVLQIVLWLILANAFQFIYRVFTLWIAIYGFFRWNQD